MAGSSSSSVTTPGNISSTMILIVIGVGILWFFLVSWFVQMLYNGSIRKLGGKKTLAEIEAIANQMDDEYKLPKCKYDQAMCLVLMITFLLSYAIVGRG